MFEPCFPLYNDRVRMAGGILKQVPLVYSAGKRKFNPEDLRKALSDKTKIFLFNNPNNPTGKNFSKEEIEQITSVLDEFP